MSDANLEPKAKPRVSTKNAYSKSEPFRFSNPFLSFSHVSRRQPPLFFLLLSSSRCHKPNKLLILKIIFRNSQQSSSIMSSLRMQFLYLNTAKSLTQILVLWLAFLALTSQAEDATSTTTSATTSSGKPLVAPWISNLHSFAAGGSYPSGFAIELDVCVCLFVRCLFVCLPVFLTISLLSHIP